MQACRFSIEKGRVADAVLRRAFFVGFIFVIFIKQANVLK
mgnify:CR=1 FL=1